MKRLLQYTILSLIFFVSIKSSADTLIYSKVYGNFQNAVSISSGRGEFVFVSDAGTNQVFKFTTEGKNTAKFGGTGFGLNELSSPISIDATDGLDVFVCDYQNNRIQKLDYKLNFITGFDFNQYNLTAENSKKILYPAGITILSTGDIAVLINNSEFKAALIKSLSDVNIFMGSNFGYDRIGAPKKIVRGKELDLWILDGETGESVNFSSTGQYIKRLKPEVTDNVLNITFFDNNLYMLTGKNIIKYDLKAGKFDKIVEFSIEGLEKINDFTLLNNSTFLFLTSKKVYEFNLIN
jgi:DNA-binding beta-propeller fold protein YncE